MAADPRPVLRALTLALLLTGDAAASAPRVDIRTAPGGAFRLTGSFSVKASTAAAWGVITDYGRIAGFVPSVRESRVLRRRGRRVLIEQELEGRFFVFSETVRLRLLVTEKPPKEVDFRQQPPSPLRAYAGEWLIQPSSGGCSVTYRLRAEPGPGMGPGFAERHAMLKDARQLLDRVRAEMARRARSRPGQTGGGS